ncbi:MAG: GNAT family N-acetyltransferase [Candidatus Eisenbacteria bacterium]|nr:GNAT family N-acetyltransferase [Candidatus Eisenbacteria bacterium]
MFLGYSWGTVRRIQLRLIARRFSICWKGAMSEKGKIVVTPLTLSNSNEVVELCLFSHPADPEPHFQSQDVSNGKNLKAEYLSEVLQQVPSCGFVAYLNGKAIGFVEFYPAAITRSLGLQIPGAGKNSVVIGCLHVSPGFTGMGVARSLLEHLVDHGKKLKWDSIYTKAFVAEEFNFKPDFLFKKCGFRTAKKSGKSSLLMRYRLKK